MIQKFLAMSLEDIRNYINDIRHQSANQPLNEGSVKDNPFDQFSVWFEEAVNAQILDPFAMIVSTVSEIGYPSMRTVYMRDISEDGIVFYTNYNSQKGRDIRNNPSTALLFLWVELERQIRISGSVERVSPKMSDEYFAGRPRESQLGAWASNQSDEIQDRQILVDSYKYYEEKFKGLEVPRPENWGGYVVHPEKFEFWQGRPSRLHDRIAYFRDNLQAPWEIKRLSP